MPNDSETDALREAPVPHTPPGTQPLPDELYRESPGVRLALHQALEEIRRAAP